MSTHNIPFTKMYMYMYVFNEKQEKLSFSYHQILSSYSRTSVARTLMARLPRLFLESLGKSLGCKIWDNLV